MKKQIIMVILIFSMYAHASDIGSPLIMAVREGNYQHAQALLAQGADPNQQDQFTAPLQYAAAENNTRMIDLLLRNGARINFQDREGKTPLHYAAMNRARNAAELLISKGADVQSPDQYGKRPIEYPMIKQLDRQVYTGKFMFSGFRRSK